MQFVRVTEPGMSLFSRFSWKGEVIDGKVKLKPGFNTWHFTDMEPVEHYQKAPRGTAAECRKIEEITEEEFHSA